MTPAELKSPIVSALHALLKPEGFRKSGAVFRRQSEDVYHLVEVQGSRANVSDDARFTVNVGVFAPQVVYADIREHTRPSLAASHWRERIGFLCAEQSDLWWEVCDLRTAEGAARDLVARVRGFALPELNALPNLAALIHVWTSGESPGIPPKLRQDFLHRLGLLG